MKTTRFFEWFQLVALVCLVGLGLGHAIVLYARHVHVVVIDRQRSLWQGLADLLSIVLFFLWAYESIAYSWPLRNHVFPALLGTVLVDAAWVKAVGAVIVLAGLLIFALALWAFAGSWRIGIDRESPGVLVTSGIFEGQIGYSGSGSEECEKAGGSG